VSDSSSTTSGTSGNSADSMSTMKYANVLQCEKQTNSTASHTKFSELIPEKQISCFLGVFTQLFFRNTLLFF